MIWHCVSVWKYLRLSVVLQPDSPQQDVAPAAPHPDTLDDDCLDILPAPKNSSLCIRDDRLSQLSVSDSAAWQHRFHSINWVGIAVLWRSDVVWFGFSGRVTVPLHMLSSDVDNFFFPSLSFFFFFKRGHEMQLASWSCWVMTSCLLFHQRVVHRVRYEA